MFFKSRRPFPKIFLDLEKLFKPENMHVFKCRNVFQLPRKILFKLKNASGPKSVFTRANFFFLKICFQLRSQKVLKCTKSSSFFLVLDPNCTVLHDHFLHFEYCFQQTTVVAISLLFHCVK